MIEITVQRPGTGERTLSFDQDTIRVGRDPRSDLVLDGEGCSRHHAEIRHQGGHYRIVDLGSTNGLRFGGRKVPELLLFDDAQIEIGECTLTFAVKGGADRNKTAVLTFDEDGALRAVKQPPAEAPQPVAREPEPPAAQPEPASTRFLLVPRGKKVQNFKVALGTDYVIGRSPNADVVLKDKKSSLEHALITSRGDHFLLRDLGSSNGTLLRGEPVTEAEIEDGDTFVVGDTPITLSTQRFDLSDEAILMDKTHVGVRIPSEMIGGHTPEAGGSESSTEPRFELRRTLSPRTMMALAAMALFAMAAAYWVLSRPSGEVPGSQATTSSAEEGLRVAVRAVERKSLADVITGSGNIEPLDEAVVGSEVGGRIVALNVSVGSTVTAGTVMARLNDRDIRLQIEEARSSVTEEQVELAREDRERKQRLFDQGVVTRSVLDASKNNYLSLDSAFNSSRARIRQLEEQLTKTSIRAPFSGVVVHTFAGAGELIGPGSPVIELEDQSSVLIELEVADRDVVRIDLGLPVQASVDAFPGRVFEGKVSTVGSTANPATKSFTVEARIDNSDGSLRSGMIASLDILLSSREGLAAPAEALIEVRDDRATVFEAVDGVVHRRAVTVGRRVDREVEILDGLDEGALVVVTGQQQLSDGDAVTVYSESD